MLFMVIERFKAGHPGPVGERFQSRGRLIPEGAGLQYITSWMAADGGSCFQIMEAPTRESLDPWIANWADLVDFEVVPIVSSVDYWKLATAGLARS